MRYQALVMMNLLQPKVSKLPDVVAEFLAQTFAGYARASEPTLIVRPKGPVMFYRWWLIRDEKLCSVYINRHVGSDDLPAPHDHPWDNMTIVLDGQFSEELYRENELCETVVRTKGDVVLRTATFAHRIQMRPGEECWTLFITGPAVNKWSFKCPGGPVPAELFLHPLRPLTEPGPGCEAIVGQSARTLIADETEATAIASFACGFVAECRRAGASGGVQLRWTQGLLVHL